LAAPSLGKDVQRMLVTLGLEYKELDPKKCAEALAKTENTKLETFFRPKKENPEA
jgi:RecB family endonuclease NucS